MADRVDELRSRLNADIVEPQGTDTSHQCFIPHDRLRELVSKEVVAAILKQQKFEFGKTCPKKELLRFICEDAYRVFVILVCHAPNFQLLDYIYKFHLGDHVLPLQKKGGSAWKLIYCCGDIEKTISSSDIKDEKQCSKAGMDFGNFCNGQWPYLSPVFSTTRFHYKFDGHICLPFLAPPGDQTEIISGFGVVKEKLVYRGHLETDVDVLVTDKGHARVAIKELKGCPDLANVAAAEAASLELMGEIKHAHLIRALASYRYNDRYFFMFPWADEGNLWSFWETHTPQTDDGYMTWFFEQLAGIAGAIQKLHYGLQGDGGTRSKKHCRHGDLKPQNILCFSVKKRSGGGSNPSVRLVIADVGLAKVNHVATLATLRAASRTPTTVLYQAPQIDTAGRAPRSRRYDIWSIGCIFLEFVVWLLYGFEKLDQFNKCHDPTFYVVDKSTAPATAKLHPHVDLWIEAIRSDPRCPEGTAVRRLVDHIATRLLEVELTPDDPEGLVGDDGPSSGEPASDAAPWVVLRAPTGLDESPKNRANAEEMHEEIAAILSDLEGGRIKAIVPGDPNPNVPPAYPEAVGLLEPAAANRAQVSQR